LFAFRERSRNTGFSCYIVTPLSKNCCSTSSFTTGYKRLLKEDSGLFDGDFDWLPLLLLLAVPPPEQLSAPRTLYIGFRKAKREHGTEPV
jgi:hypothetical protein